MGIPSSVDLVSSDPSLMVASFNTGHTSIFNMETRQRILTLESGVDNGMYSKQKKIARLSSNAVNSLFSVSKQLGKWCILVTCIMYYVKHCVLRCRSKLLLLY